MAIMIRNPKRSLRFLRRDSDSPRMKERTLVGMNFKGRLGSLRGGSEWAKVLHPRTIRNRDRYGSSILF